LLPYQFLPKHFQKGVGIIAALILCLAYGFVVAGHVVTADVPSTFFGIFALFFLLNYLGDAKTKNLLFSSALVGIGTATKYYPMVMLLPIVASIALVRMNLSGNFIKKIGNVLLFSALSVGVFFIFYFLGSPFNFLDPLGREATFGKMIELIQKLAHFSPGFLALPTTTDVVAESMTYSEGSIDYLKTLWATTGLGPFIATISLLGMITLPFTSNKRQCFVFMIFPLIFAVIAVLINPGYSQARHQAPIYPYLALAGGNLVVTVAGGDRLRQIAIYSLALLLLCFPLFRILETGFLISKTDTRNLAKIWVEKNIPAGSKIFRDGNGIRLNQSEKNLRELVAKNIRLKPKATDPKGLAKSKYNKYLEYQIEANKNAVTYDITSIRYPWWLKSFTKKGRYLLKSERDLDMASAMRPLGVLTYEAYVKAGYQYAIVDNAWFKIFLDEKNQKKLPSYARFYQELSEKGTLIQAFDPSEEKKPGKHIKIFQISEK